MEGIRIPYKSYKVAGAGEIHIEEGTASTGGALGKAIGVTWGKHGVIGGVIDRREIKRLVKDLTEWLCETKSKTSKRKYIDPQAEIDTKVDSKLKRMKDDFLNYKLIKIWR